MDTLKKYSIAIVLVFFIISNCSKSPRCSGSDQNKGLIKELVVIPCELLKEGEEFVVNDEASYKSMFDSGCVLPAIDFTSSTLLGQVASGGCKVKFIREVKNKGNGKIHYGIKVKECGRCKTFTSSYNWVTVPKIINAEDVSFEVE